MAHHAETLVKTAIAIAGLIQRSPTVNRLYELALRKTRHKLSIEIAANRHGWNWKLECGDISAFTSNPRIAQADGGYSRYGKCPFISAATL